MRLYLSESIAWLLEHLETNHAFSESCRYILISSFHLSFNTHECEKAYLLNFLNVPEYVMSTDDYIVGIAPCQHRVGLRIVKCGTVWIR
jgi:hypothetical protein